MRISDWSSDVCTSDLCSREWRWLHLGQIGSGTIYLYEPGWCSLLLPAGPRRQSEDDRCDAYPRLFNDGHAARWTQARLLLQGSRKRRGLRAHLFLLVYDSRAGDRQQRWLYAQGKLRVTDLWAEFPDIEERAGDQPERRPLGPHSRNMPRTHDGFAHQNLFK